MEVQEAIMTRRSIRKFQQDPIPAEMLTGLVDAARMAAFGANRQPLKFCIIDDPAHVAAILPATKWGGYLADGMPKEGERPVAYVAVLADGDIKPPAQCEVDAGAAITNMLLAAHAAGIGACWLGAIDRSAIMTQLGLQAPLHLLYLVALGYPAQQSVAEEDGSTVRYYLDDAGVLHVPKRPLSEVLVSVKGEGPCKR